MEKLLEQRGHKILWTLSYCPKVQQIKVFCANSKNHVAFLYNDVTTMRDVVRRLQDGWYGNEHRLLPCDNVFTCGTTCAGLVQSRRRSNARTRSTCPFAPDWRALFAP